MPRFLFIAEKTSVMNSVKAVYQKNEQQIRQAIGDIDFIDLNGHVCRYLEPNEYSNWKDVKWSQMDLPLSPDPFLIAPIDNDFKKRKLNGVKQMLKNNRYDGLIVATDADTEGNGIYYLLCEHLNLKGYRTLRFYEESMTEREILKSLSRMTDFYTNPRDIQMTDAFLLRSQFDWMLGMNSTIAVSRKAGGNVYKVGRVKAQTMNIVYHNSEACDNFVPHSDYEIHANYADGFTGVLMEDKAPMSFEKKEDADRYIADELSAVNTVEVVNVERKQAKTLPPQLYKLSTLQVEAGSQLNMTPQEVLDVVQSLYQKGYVSYPRTDGECISTEKAKELPQLVMAAGKVPGLDAFVKGFKKADLERAVNNKKFVNDDEVKKASHDALLPTSVKFDYSALPAIEKQIYEMICKRLVVQFLPELVEEKTVLDAKSGNHMFHSTGNRVVEKGWTELLPKKNKAELIPQGIQKGSQLLVEDLETHEKKASPPKRLTVATLISAMEGIAKFISDKALKKAFVAAKGIGTPATRGAIIDDLIHTGYMESKGKTNQLFITDMGRSYIKMLSGMSIINPEQAAEWETYFQAVKAGTMGLNEAKKLCFDYVDDMVREVDSMTVQANIVDGVSCPYCGGSIVSGRWAFQCQKYPSGCKFTVSKANGRFTDVHLKELVKNGRTGVIKGVIHSAKNKKDYDAAVVLQPKGSENATKAEFPQSGNAGGKINGLLCPYCQKGIVDDRWSYHCEDYKNGCTFSVSKADGKLKEKDLMELITRGRTRKIAKIIHSSKNNKDYDAVLVLQPKGSPQATKAEFPPPAGQK